MFQLQMQLRTILPILLIASSTSSQPNLRVKRTSNDNENHKRFRQDEQRLAVLWGASIDEDEMVFVENNNRLLGGSHSYSQSSSDDNDDDDNGYKINHLMTEPIIPPGNAEFMVIAKPEDFATGPKMTTSSSSSTTNEESPGNADFMVIANPEDFAAGTQMTTSSSSSTTANEELNDIVEVSSENYENTLSPTAFPTKMPTSTSTVTPTPSPTVKKTKTSANQSSTSSTKKENNVESSQNVDKNVEHNNNHALKTVRTCPANIKKDDTTTTSPTNNQSAAATATEKLVYLKEFSFNYAVELNAFAHFTSRTISTMEDRILDIVAHELHCDDNVAKNSNFNNRQRRTTTAVGNSKRSSHIILIDSQPDDMLSTTNTCTTTSRQAGQCLVVEGKMIVGFHDDDVSNSQIDVQAVRQALTVIKYNIDDDSIISTMPGVIKLRYLGPDPDQALVSASEAASSESNDGGWDSWMETLSQPLMMVAFVGAFVCFLVSGLCCLKYKIKSDEERWERKFKEARGDFSPSSSHSSIEVDETESEASDDNNGGKKSVKDEADDDAEQQRNKDT